MDDYRPSEYWTTRLQRHFDLRGTGHVSYSRGYNAWLYRAKRRALRVALTGLRPPLDALDVGSGTGWCVDQLLRFGADVEGADLVSTSVERLGERFPQATFFKLELGREPIPRPDSCYDLITALDVLYHVVDDERFESAISELSRVLRPTGRFVITDGLCDRDTEPATHVRFRSVERWRSVCERHGLTLREPRPLYRWLSRDHDGSALSRLPDALRGGVEFGLESLVPRRPHMRCAVIERVSSAPSLPT